MCDLCSMGAVCVRFDVRNAVFLADRSDTRCPERDDIPVGRGSRS